MTSLQIDYWKLKETERTNKANEGLRGAELAETIRHNKANEELGWAQVGVKQYEANTARMHELAWKDIQDQLIVIQSDANDIASRRNDLQELDIQLGFERLSYDMDKWKDEFDLRSRSLDQEDARLKISRSQNARQWVDSIVGAINDTSRTAIQGARTASDIARARSDYGFNDGGFGSWSSGIIFGN